MTLIQAMEIKVKKIILSTNMIGLAKILSFFLILCNIGIRIIMNATGSSQSAINNLIGKPS